ncbi:PREDICTED: uncharacterized protein LOC109232860 [Nicotiana attenuata]|uniref:uncharacterized protein LOC109232860 n=1 Tax=Nicotiana attenuata TaxID=49451 RepID=UPI0009058B90|nr:PREDICTED: uncharacterized protein LOC109232860 [Nicotiana attenuata]
MPVHLLSAVSPPKTVMKQIEKLAANFFWGLEKDKHKYHWASWGKLCKPSSWSNFLMAKYYQRSHPISKKWDTGQSQAWKSLMTNKKEAEQHIRWRLHSGEVSFWWDNWLGTAPLTAHRTEGGKPGNFTCASAWETIRRKKQHLLSNKKTWHKKLPFKWSFCLWRAIRNKIPTDDRVVAFGNPTVTRCACCSRPQAETVNHIFSTGKNVVQQLLLDTTPTIIYWNLWKNRCNAKYGGRASSMIRVLYSIDSDIHLLLRSCYPHFNWPSKWIGLYSMTKNLQQTISITKVVWRTPQDNFVKITSDGTALSNLGKIRAGTIIRDQHGNFIHAMATPLGEGTNNQAETEAAIIGVQWCLENGYTKEHLEVDSALLITWINSTSEPPWSLQMFIQKLKDLSQHFEEFKCSHVYREANFPADSLSKLSHELEHMSHFNCVQELPPHIRGQIRLDQLDTLLSGTKPQIGSKCPLIMLPHPIPLMAMAKFRSPLQPSQQSNSPLVQVKNTMNMIEHQSVTMKENITAAVYTNNHLFSDFTPATVYNNSFAGTLS